VILLDIGLPGMNGYDICQRLRERSWAQAVIIIALTGWGQEADREKSRAAGFDHHLVKPVAFPELLALVTAGDTIRTP
jgi:DNA-binding response OmpR family regulator